MSNPNRKYLLNATGFLGRTLFLTSPISQRGEKIKVIVLQNHPESTYPHFLSPRPLT